MYAAGCFIGLGFGVLGPRVCLDDGSSAWGLEV